MRMGLFSSGTCEGAAGALPGSGSACRNRKQAADTMSPRPKPGVLVPSAAWLAAVAAAAAAAAEDDLSWKERRYALPCFGEPRGSANRSLTRSN